MNIKKLLKALFHPTTVKTVGVILIVSYFFILPTYAADTNDSLQKFKDFLGNILSLCSWGWIVLSILAGKLMTNDRVYGSVLHMDIYLWKIRNIMKNFANFALVGVILRNIVSNLISKKGMNIKDLITKTLIAGILIQASRFLVGALVDISTIATSAVGSFPTNFLTTDSKIQKQIRDSLNRTPTDIVVDMEKLKTIDTQSNDHVSPELWNTILPTYDSVSGPLMYLGFSVFKFQNYLNVDNTGTELTIAFLLRLVLILAYTLGLALLFIANIIRVAFLRIFIIGAPLIILSRLFFKDAGVGGQSSKGGIGKWLKFSVMIDMIFKPVIFVAGFSFIIILVASMQNIMEGSIPKKFNGVEIAITDNASTLNVEGLSTIKVNENNVFGKDSLMKDAKDIGSTIFVNLIIFFMTIFLIRQFIKISLTTGEGPIQKTMKGLTEFIEKTAMTLPLIPVGHEGTSITAASQFFKSNRKQMLQGFGVSEKGKFGQYDPESKSFELNEDKFRSYLGQKMGLEKDDWKESDWNKLKNIANSTPDSFFSESIALAKKRNGGLSLGNTERVNVLKIALKTNSKKFGFNPPYPNDTDNLEDFLEGTNAQIFYKLMGGDAATGRYLSENSDLKYKDIKDIAFHANAKN